MSTDTKLCLHNITYRTLNYGGEIWILNQKGVKIKNREIALVEATARFHYVEQKNGH
jgi:hypothetical protein